MTTAFLEAGAGVELFDVSVSRGRARTDAAASTVRSTALHPAILKIAAGSYALMIAVFWIAFVRSAMLAEAMVIVTVCLVAYAGLPWSMAVMARRFNARHGVVEPAAGSLRRFLAGRFETVGGTVSGTEAFVLVTTVPICLLLASIAFAVIYHTLA